VQPIVPTLRTVAAFVALDRLATPCLQLMAAKPDAAEKFFEAYRKAVEIVLREHPEFSANLDVDRVARRMLDEAGGKS
jgi:hypothetical protein